MWKKKKISERERKYAKEKNRKKGTSYINCQLSLWVERKLTDSCHSGKTILKLFLQPS